MLSDAEVIQKMRELLSAPKALLPSVALNGAPAHMLRGWPEVSTEASAAAPATAAVNLNALPDKPPVPPLLPVLEDVQMQTAKVLPEIDQTLEQIDTTIAEIDEVSLAPAPLQIPKVQEAMTDAGDAVEKTLDGL